MKKFFKEINLLKLFISLLSIILCVLMTTFLILCREWINDSGGLFVYVGVCIFDIVIGGGLILCFCFETWQLIENKKQNKNNINNKNLSTDEIKNNINNTKQDN